MDTLIQLGSFIFKDLEIPEKINFGGAQQLAQHNLIGGGRIIDALGQNDMDITWSGLFYGLDAMTRAQQLNKLRAQGQQLKLKWFNLNYDVVIQNFEAQTEKFFQITYTITLRVIRDGSNPNAAQNLIGFNEAIRNDFASANTISDNLVDPALQGDMNNLNNALNGVPTFNGASQAQIASVQGPLDTAIAAVNNAIRELRIAIFGDQGGNL